ncbi:troponin C, isoallergen Bla g 6.0101-like [Schistocerca cancellata]|uniref:troponin C, isoallergen Bla g 6.0101-like n=1 Tax=Schistocerca cancellata TaxID=274614 RepID=UPI002118A7B5|nr:troponin C, isoallergen Bla g 6.0101-like [Schistocerca cancellata]
MCHFHNCLRMVFSRASHTSHIIRVPGIKLGARCARLDAPRIQSTSRRSRGRASAKMEELPPEQIAVLKKAFDVFDHQKTGSIGTDMVRTILEMLGLRLNEKQLQEIIEEVDADGSGQLEFDEFVQLAARFLVEEDAEAMQQELREAFRLYDKEGNGYITTGVLREILRELDDKITEEELDMMIEEIDSDGSGTVDFDEFMEVMTGGDD